MSKKGAEILLNEYMTACYGTTEYPEDLSGVVLKCVGNRETKQIDYNYKCRNETVTNVKNVEAVIPQINTKVTVYPVNDGTGGYIREGYAFSPMFTLGLTKKITNNEELISCLKVQKAN